MNMLAAARVRSLSGLALEEFTKAVGRLLLRR
jgi:hypothetical protein